MTTTQLTDAQEAEMILRGIKAKIDEILKSAEQSKALGDMRQWANYLSVAADWAHKLVETNIEFNKARVGA